MDESIQKPEMIVFVRAKIADVESEIGDQKQVVKMWRGDTDKSHSPI